MDNPSSEFSIRRVEEWAQYGHQEDEAAASEALGEGLRIPGKERHRPDHRQVQKAALYAPVDCGGGRTGVMV